MILSRLIHIRTHFRTITILLLICSGTIIFRVNILGSHDAVAAGKTSSSSSMASSASTNKSAPAAGAAVAKNTFSVSAASAAAAAAAAGMTSSLLLVSSAASAGKTSSKSSARATLLNPAISRQFPTSITADLIRVISRSIHSPTSVAVCDGPASTAGLLIVVCSAAENFQRRQLIRRTWGNRSTTAAEGISVVFLVGTPSALPDGGATLENPSGVSGPRDDLTRAKELQSAIDTEADHHGDVLQAGFDDTYVNLTLKSIAMLRYVSTSCPRTRCLMKCDDDVIINTPLLAHDMRDTVHKRFVMGHLIAYAQPIRRPGAKWYTPPDAFPSVAYPTYASGAAYLISGDVIADMYREGISGRTRLFWIEDVFVTGVLARRAGVQLISNGKFDGYRQFMDVCGMRKHIVLHRLSPEEVELMWSIVNGSYTNCGPT